MLPNQRCHSSDDVASMPGDDARRQPAIAAPIPNTAPARRFASATARQSDNPVAIATTSATPATRTSPMGKCTSKGCNRPMSAISLIQTEGRPQIFRRAFPGLDAEQRRRYRSLSKRRCRAQRLKRPALLRFTGARWLSKSDADAADDANRGSLSQTNTVHDVLESGVGAQRVEAGPQQSARVETLVIASLEPRHRFGRVAERCVHHGDLGGIRIGAIRALLQTCQQLFCLGAPAG